MFERVRTLERVERSGGSLALRSRELPSGVRFEVVVGGRVAMGSGDGQSERLLADLVLQELAGRSGLRVLIGGLGLGFTLGRVLEHQGVERVRVVEMEPAVIRWNRTALREINGDALASSRVEVILGEVLAVADRGDSEYDAILLDVDNGPSMLLHPDNGAIYQAPGLARMHAALKPGGMLGVWCNQEEPALHDALSTVFGQAHLELFREPGYPRKAPPTAIHLAQRR